MSMKPTPFAILLGFLVSGLHLRSTLAATPTASFGVTATVQATCAVSVSTTAPGLYSAAKATAAVSVTCSHLVPYTVGINGGPGIASVATPKMMDADSNSLRYALVSRSTGTVNRCPIAKIDRVAATRDGSPQVVADGREISARQYAGTGIVDGSIVVTVTY
jgi:spore coat protein U-like protein